MSVPSVEQPAELTSDALTACMTIYHDGSCPLCNREIALIKSLNSDTEITFKDVSQVDPGAAVSDGLTAADAMRRFHVRRADGTLLSGAAAFIEMWSTSPKLKFLAPLGRSRTAVAALDAVYSGFLVVRPGLSKALKRYDAWRARR